MHENIKKLKYIPRRFLKYLFLSMASCSFVKIIFFAFRTGIDCLNRQPVAIS